MKRLTLALLPLLALASCDKLAAAAEPVAAEPTAAPAESSASSAAPTAPDQSAMPAAPKAEYDAAGYLKSAYAVSSAYSDWTSAAALATQLVIEEPNESAKWLEELARAHFNNRNFMSCIKIIADLNEQHGGSAKLPLQELKAMSLEVLGQKTEARDAWKVVWDMGGSAWHAVRLGMLQFEFEDLDAAEATIALGFGAADVKTATLPLIKSGEEMQNIPAAAALHNLKALVLIKRSADNKEEARAHFEAALALAPGFALAKRNMAALETLPAPAAKSSGSTAKPK